MPDLEEETCCVCNGPVDSDNCHRAEYEKINLDLAICGDECLAVFQSDEEKAIAGRMVAR